MISFERKYSFEEADDSLRFRVYVNYLVSIKNYLKSNYSTPNVLIDQISRTASFRRIRMAQSLDKGELSRVMRNAWLTELQIYASSADREFIPYSNHWAPVQLYYQCYLSIRGLFLASGQSIRESHPAALKRISNEIRSRPDIFPYPWKVTYGGDPRKSGRYLNLPSSVTVNVISPLTTSRRVSFFDSFGLLLKTTRERQIDSALKEWKRKEHRKRLSAVEREYVIAGLHETTFFDFLYRLRIRSNYTDADSFLFSVKNRNDTLAFNQSIKSIGWYTMLLLEVLVAKYIGRDAFIGIADLFIKHAKSTLSNDVLCRRRNIINQATF